jgi:hypothetical protein
LAVSAHDGIKLNNDHGKKSYFCAQTGKCIEDTGGLSFLSSNPITKVQYGCFETIGSNGL